jgi:transcriptional regulator with GAF, ATPase, and Fis domain
MTGTDTLDGLLELAASASRARGDGLHATLARSFARTLKASTALISHAADPGRVRTLAVFAGEAPQPNYEYAVAGSPCAAVLRGEVVHQESGPTGRIPNTSRDYRGYYGVPITGGDGSVMGHLCAFGTDGLQVSAHQRMICEILAGRASGELQRLRAEQLRRASESRMEVERAGLLARHRHLHDQGEIIGASPALAHALDTLSRVASTDATVLISGETGTGKELFARAIHAASRRTDSAFIKFDCAARPSRLRTLELFGDGESALDLASGGTILLDEIAELGPDAQARLLPALQERIDVRIIVTTNRDLRKAVNEGRFREDLYYRLNVFPIELPPLRARAEDIPALLQFFAEKYASRVGRRVDGVDPDTLAALTRYAWPGNVRELENLVERALVLNTSPLLKIPPEILAAYSPDGRADAASAATGMQRIFLPSGQAPNNFDDTENTGLHHVQREHILRVLNATHWVIEGNHGAALKLGMKPATLRHRMKKLGIARAPNPAAQAEGAASGSEIR